jgi:hypothetical protein
VSDCAQVDPMRSAMYVAAIEVMSAVRARRGVPVRPNSRARARRRHAPEQQDGARAWRVERLLAHRTTAERPVSAG